MLQEATLLWTRPYTQASRTETSIFQTSEDILHFFLRQAVLQSTNQATTLPTQVTHAAFVVRPSDVNGSKNTYSVPVIWHQRCSVTALLGVGRRYFVAHVLADETVCGHVCVKVHADMHMSGVFITCWCILLTSAVVVETQIGNELSILKIAWEENELIF